MSKIYRVQFETTVLVEGEDAEDAYSRAREDKREIVNDEEMEIMVIGEVASLEELPCGWDRKCLPYGGDGMTRLESILPPNG